MAIFSSFLWFCTFQTHTKKFKCKIITIIMIFFSSMWYNLYAPTSIASVKSEIIGQHRWHTLKAIFFHGVKRKKKQVPSLVVNVFLSFSSSLKFIINANFQWIFQMVFIAASHTHMIHKTTSASCGFGYQTMKFL